MQQRTGSLGGLGTRIGLRTFVLFCLCAMLPTALFAFIAYREVSRELTANARARLAETSKNYGILINERLIQVDTLLADYARSQLLESVPEKQPSLRSPHVQILQVLNEASATTPAKTPRGSPVGEGEPWGLGTLAIMNPAAEANRSASRILSLLST